MNTEWSLDILYKGLDDPAYEEDIKTVTEKIESLKALVKKAADMSEKEMAEQILTEMEQFMEVMYHLMDYVMLSQSVDTENGALMAQVNRLNQLCALYTPVESAARKCLAKIENVEQLAEESEIVKAYTFFLKENKENAKHLLADEVEEMAAAMDITGGSAWGKLFSYLTSTVKVDYEGKTVTLSEV